MTDIGTAHGAIELDLSPLGRAVQAGMGMLRSFEQSLERMGQGADQAAQVVNHGMAQAAAGIHSLVQSAGPLTSRLGASNQAMAAVGQGSAALVAGLRSAVTGFDAVGTGVKKAGESLTHFQSLAKAAGGVLQGIFQGIGQMVAQAFANIGQSIVDLGKSLVMGNAQFETYETGFKVLLGSVGAAQDRIEELAEFGARTPFELPGVVEADRILQGFGLHAEEAAQKFGFSGRQIREIAGDVASGAQTSFQDMAKYIGQFSAGATGQALARFEELGIVTRTQLREMGLEFSKAGELISPLPEAMNVLLTVMKEKYGGMMAEQSKTLNGMLSNLADWQGEALRILGEPLFDEFKEDMAALLATLSSPSFKAGLRAFAIDLAGAIKVAHQAFIDFATGVSIVLNFLEPLFSFISHNAIPILDGLTAATIAYTVSQLAAKLATVGSIPALIAYTSTMATAALATLAAAAPFIALAAAITGTIMVYQKWQSISQDAANMWLQQNQTYQDGVKALGRYELASYAVRKATAAQADELRRLQQEQAADVQLRAEMFRAGQTESDAYRESTARINERTDKMKLATAALEGDITAAEQGALALDEMSGATQGLGEQADRTAEELDELRKAAVEAAEEGAKAFGQAVQAEVGFMQERADARGEHAAKVTDIESTYLEDLAELNKQAAAATTAEQRAALAERYADLVTSHNDQRATEEAAFAESERQAAEAYAREQAAQLAHLGQMLINLATAKGQENGVSAAAIAEMTQKLAAEYGVQQSVVGRSYEGMVGSIEEWATSNGENTDQVIADMGRLRDGAVTTQQEVDRQISQMTDQAKADFDAGKITLDQYVERLRKIPAAAEDAAAALAAIPTKVESEIIVTTTSRSRQRQGGEVTGDEGPQAPPGRATGGRVAAGQPYLMGERRIPEIVVPDQPGFVLPDARSALAALARMQAAPAVPLPSARSMPSLNLGGIHVTISGAVVNNADQLRAVADQIGDAVLVRVERLFDQMTTEGV